MLCSQGTSGGEEELKIVFINQQKKKPVKKKSQTIREKENHFHCRIGASPPARGPRTEYTKENARGKI